jgi:hypothetical protein
MANRCSAMQQLLGNWAETPIQSHSSLPLSLPPQHHKRAHVRVHVHQHSPHLLHVNMTILVRRCPSLTAARGMRTVLVASSYSTSLAVVSGFNSRLTSVFLKQGDREGAEGAGEVAGAGRQRGWQRGRWCVLWEVWEYKCGAYAALMKQLHGVLSPRVGTALMLVVHGGRGGGWGGLG